MLFIIGQAHRWYAIDDEKTPKNGGSLHPVLRGGNSTVSYVSSSGAPLTRPLFLHFEYRVVDGRIDLNLGESDRGRQHIVFHGHRYDDAFW